MNSNTIKKLIERVSQINSEFQADQNFIQTLYQSIETTAKSLPGLQTDKQLNELLKTLSLPKTQITDLAKELNEKSLDKIEKERKKEVTQQQRELGNTTSLLMYIEKFEQDFKKKYPSGQSTSSQENAKYQELEKLKKIVTEYRQRLNGFEQRNVVRRDTVNNMANFTGLNPFSPNFTEFGIKSSAKFVKNSRELEKLIKASTEKAKKVNSELAKLAIELKGTSEIKNIQELVDLAKKKGDLNVDKRINLLLDELYGQKERDSVSEEDGLITINRRIRSEEDILGIPQNILGEVSYNRKFVPTTENIPVKEALSQDPVKAEIGSKSFTNRAKIAAALETTNEGTKVDVKKFVRELTSDPQYKDTYDSLIIQFTDLIKKNDYNKINEVITSYRQGGDIKLLGVVKAARKAALESKWDNDRAPKVMLLPVEALSENLDEPLLPYATEIIQEEGGIDSYGLINSQQILVSPAKKKVIEDKIRRKLYTHKTGYELSSKVGGHLVRKIENVSPLLSAKIPIKGSDQKINALTLLSREISLDLSAEISRIFDRNVELYGGNLLDARRVTTEYIETKLKDLSSIDRSVYETVERVKKEQNLAQFSQLTPELLNEVIANASDGIRTILEGEAFSIVPESILKVNLLSEADNQDTQHNSVLEIEEEVLANSKTGRTIVASKRGVESKVQPTVNGKPAVSTVKRTQRFVQLPNSDSIVEAYQRIGLEVEEGNSVLEYAQKELNLKDKFNANNKDWQMSEMDESILAAFASGELIPFLQMLREKKAEDTRNELIGTVIGHQNVHGVKGIFDTKENIEAVRDILDDPSNLWKRVWNKGIPFFDNTPDDALKTKVRKAFLRGFGLRQKVVLDDGQEREVNVVTFFGRRLFADRVDDFSNTKTAKFLGLDKTLKRSNRKKKNSILELALSVVIRSATTLILKFLKRIPLVKNVVEGLSQRYNSFMSGEGGRILNKSLATVKVAGNLSSAGIAGIQRGAMGAAIGGLVFGAPGLFIGGGIATADGFLRALIHGEKNLYRTPLFKNIDSWFGAELAERQTPGMAMKYVNKFTKTPTNLGEMLRKDTVLSVSPTGMPQRITPLQQIRIYNPVTGLTEIQLRQVNISGISRFFSIEGRLGRFMRTLRVFMAGKYSTLLSLGKFGFTRSLGTGIFKKFTLQRLNAWSSTLSSSMLWGTVGYVLFGSNPIAAIALAATKIGLDRVVAPLIQKGFATGIKAFTDSRIGKLVTSAFKLPVFESLGLGAGVYSVLDTIKTLLDDSLTPQQKMDIILDPINMVTGTMNIFGYIGAIRMLPAAISVFIGESSLLARIMGSSITAPAIAPIKGGMIIGSIVGGLFGMFMGGGPATVIFASTAGAILGGVLAGVLTVLFPPLGVPLSITIGGIVGGLGGGFIGGSIGKAIDSAIGAAGDFLKLIGVFLGLKKFFSSSSLSERLTAIVQLAFSVGSLGAGAVVAMSVVVPMVTPGLLVPVESTTRPVKKFVGQTTLNTLQYSISIVKGSDFSDPKVQNINIDFTDTVDAANTFEVKLAPGTSSNFSISGKTIKYKYSGPMKDLPFETLKYSVTTLKALKDLSIPSGYCNGINGGVSVTYIDKPSAFSQINQNVCVGKDGKEIRQTKGNRKLIVDNGRLPILASDGDITQCSYAIGGGGSHSKHFALDIAAGFGKNVTPVSDGKVVETGWDPEGYGNYIKIESPLAIGTLKTVYAHLSSLDVTTGDIVQATNVIGAVGSTGNSTGNHLHFQTYINGIEVEPCCIIDCTQYKTTHLSSALSCTNKASAFYSDPRTQCNF